MIKIEIDATSLAKLQAKLTNELYMEAVKAAFIDATDAGEGEIKARTPVVTGNLRRSVQSDVKNAGRFPDPESRVAVLAGMTGKGKGGRTVTMSEYAWWIETGETKSGRKMKSKPGGYRMFEEGARAVEARIPEIIAGIARDIEKRWGT